MSEGYYPPPYQDQAPQTNSYPVGEKKSHPYLWGILFGLLLASILLLVYYLWLYPRYNSDETAARTLELEALQAEIDMYENALKEEQCLNEAPLEEPEPAETPEGPESLDIPAMASLQQEPDLSEDPREAYNVPEKEPPPPPPAPKKKPTPPPPAPPKANPPQAKAPPKPTEPEKPKPDGPPTELKTVSDLYGCWTSEPNYRTPSTGERMFHSYCFDMSGNARSYSAYLNNAGKPTRDCRAGARAILEGDNFTLIESPPDCPGWRAGVYTCKLRATGVFRCSLKFEGSAAESLNFYYQGKS
jgi:hypothetical protein